MGRRFNRARYDAERLVAEFAARLNDAVDPGSVREDLAGTVHAAAPGTTRVELVIGGMTCAACAAWVQARLYGVTGVAAG